MADALHSIADSAAFGLNRYSAHKSSAARFWFSVFIGAITLLSGVWIFADSLATIIVGEYTHPGLLGAVVAAGSVLTNFYLYRVAACASKKSDSQASLFCMIQNKSNFHAACMALTGTALADLGLMVCDPLFAIFIGFFLFAGAFEILRDALARARPEGSSARLVIVLLLVLLSALIIGSVSYRASGRDEVILVPAEGPTPESQMDSLLGRAHYFLIVDTRRHTFKAVYNSYRFHPNDVSDHLVKLLTVEKVDVVLSRQIGPEMFKDLSAAGAKIYYVAQPQTVGQAMTGYEERRLLRATASNVARGFGRSGMQWLSPW